MWPSSSTRSLSLTVSPPSAYLPSKLRSRFRRWLGFLLRLSQQNLKKSPPKLGGDLERINRKGEVGYTENPFSLAVSQSAPEQTLSA
jgi:hypothetical protein